MDNDEVWVVACPNCGNTESAKGLVWMPEGPGGPKFLCLNCKNYSEGATIYRSGKGKK